MEQEHEMETSSKMRRFHGIVISWIRKKIAKDRKVIPDPIDDRKFHE